jgi:hypothetical protein
LKCLCSWWSSIPIRVHLQGQLSITRLDLIISSSLG